MACRYKGSRVEVRALDAYVKLMRAADSLASRLGRHIAAAGLTHSQFGVLEALFHLGPLCQRDLGRKILRSGGNLTMVVDNLEKRGFARRRRAEGDRRFVSVELTGEGRRLIERLFPTTAAAIQRELEVLSGPEQDDLGRLCRSVGLGISARTVV